MTALNQQVKSIEKAELHKCKECGFALDKTSLFCDNCGSRVKETKTENENLDVKTQVEEPFIQTDIEGPAVETQIFDSNKSESKPIRKTGLDYIKQKKLEEKKKQEKSSDLYLKEKEYQKERDNRIESFFNPKEPIEQVLKIEKEVKVEKPIVQDFSKKIIDVQVEIKELEKQIDSIEEKQLEKETWTYTNNIMETSLTFIPALTGNQTALFCFKSNNNVKNLRIEVDLLIHNSDVKFSISSNSIQVFDANSKKENYIDLDRLFIGTIDVVNKKMRLESAHPKVNDVLKLDLKG